MGPDTVETTPIDTFKSQDAATAESSGCVRQVLRWIANPTGVLPCFFRSKGYLYKKVGHQPTPGGLSLNHTLMKTHNFLLFWLLLFLFGSSLRAQLTGEAHIDSLLTVLQANPHDTVKIDGYLSLHTQLLPEDTTQSLKYLRHAISISEKTDDRKRLCQSYLALGSYYRKKGELQQAKRAIFDADQQRSSFQDYTIESTYFMENGRISYLEGTYHEAVNSFINALSIYEIVGHIEGIAECYNMIGSAYWQLEELNSALTHFLKAVKLLENEDEKKIGKFLGNIGLIYRAKNDFKKALKYYQRSLKINRRYNYKLDAAIDLQNIGVLYQKMGDIHTALKYLKASNELSVLINDQIGVLYTNHGIAAMSQSWSDYTLKHLSVSGARSPAEGQA